jgi:GT2 family glycosyltransferase
MLLHVEPRLYKSLDTMAPGRKVMADIGKHDRNVSVVIVTYKSAALTVNALRSIAADRLSSTLRINCFVVDNASGDLIEIESEIKSNNWTSWVTLIQSQKNGGFAYGNNLGIQNALFRDPQSYIYLLNPDTEIRTGAAEFLVDFLESNPSVGIAGGSFEDEDGSPWPICFRFPSIFSEIIAGLSIGLISRLLANWEVPRVMEAANQPVDWICGASMMIRPEVFKAVGGLDEHYFLYFEETDLCRRAKAAGFSTFYVPKSRVMHIRGQSTKVTELTNIPRRLPSYWFESRRRYFAVTFGVRRAIAIDLVAVVAHSIGNIKRFLLGRMSTAVPHFVRDLISHSVIWPRNRNVPLHVATTAHQMS